MTECEWCGVALNGSYGMAALPGSPALPLEDAADCAHTPERCRDALRSALSAARTEAEEARRALEDERRAHATELAHVDMSGREAGAARIADLERRLADSDDGHGEIIEKLDALEKWGEELHAALGCEREYSNLHDYFECIRHNALTLAAHYESHEKDVKDVEEARRAALEWAASVCDVEAEDWQHRELAANAVHEATSPARHGVIAAVTVSRQIRDRIRAGTPPSPAAAGQRSAGTTHTRWIGSTGVSLCNCQRGEDHGDE